MSEQRDTHEFLEKKADHAFQIKCAAQTRLSEAQSELDRREWRMQNADVALDETNMQIQSQRIERYQANHSTDQNRREKSSLCDELQMRNSFSGISCYKLTNFQEILELQKFCCVEAERARQLRNVLAEGRE